MTEIERRREVLHKYNIPEKYIDLYFFVISDGDRAYLPEEYQTEKGFADKTKLRHGLQELVILFGKLVVDEVC